MTSIDIDFFDPSSKARLFYAGKRVGLEDEIPKWQLGSDGMIILPDYPADGLKIRKFLFQGNSNFIVEGLFLDLFCKLANHMALLDKTDDYIYAVYFRKVGERSIEGISCRYGKPCSIICLALQNDLIDQRERLIEVLNAAIRALIPLSRRNR